MSEIKTQTISMRQGDDINERLNDLNIKGIIISNVTIIKIQAFNVVVSVEYQDI